MPGSTFSTRGEIRNHQLVELQRLLAAIIPANRFYSKKLSAARCSPLLATLNQFSSFPFTTKPELVEDQNAHPPFGTNLTFPIEQYTRYHQTSGTTGAPLRWPDTPQSWDAMVARWMEIFEAAGVSASDRILFAFSFGPFIGFWLAFEAGARIGALCLPAGGLSSLARLRLMLETEATVLCCTPTYALRLAEVAAAESLDLSLSRIRRMIVAGEAGGSIPTTRERLEAAWPRARVFDHHGMTETGPVTYECPKRPGFLHVMESAYVAEVIEPASGQVLDPGKTGELVLTTLVRIGSPLLRYRTGDLVMVEATAGPCVCGRPELALEGGILGRVDDMVIVRGVNVYPSAVEHLLRGCSDVAEYRVRVTRSGALTELNVEIEPVNSCADVPALVDLVRKRFEQALALRVPVSAVAPGALPRFEMKARRWQS